MRVHAVIQARVGSTRLPGKVLRRLGNLNVLEWVIRAATEAEGVDAVIVATTTQIEDDAVVATAQGSGALVVRGHELDVLSRYTKALTMYPCDAVVRLTGDCPLLDPELIRQTVAAWRATPNSDYVATTLIRTLPRGLDVEVIRSSTLMDVGRTAFAHDRAHVTSAIYSQPDLYHLLGLVVSPSSNQFRVTLDTVEDAAALDAIVDQLGDTAPPWRKVVQFLQEHPEIVALNSGVVQKNLELG